jgi:hypothetical protein
VWCYGLEKHGFKDVAGNECDVESNGGVFGVFAYGHLENINGKARASIYRISQDRIWRGHAVNNGGVISGNTYMEVYNQLNGINHELLTAGDVLSILKNDGELCNEYVKDTIIPLLEQETQTSLQ